MRFVFRLSKIKQGSRAGQRQGHGLTPGYMGFMDGLKLKKLAIKYCIFR